MNPEVIKREDGLDYNFEAHANLRYIKRYVLIMKDNDYEEKEIKREVWVG